MSAKLQISMTIKNENNEDEIIPLTVEKNIPSIRDFMNGENFRENFDILERAILQGRKEVAEGAVKEYLEKASKKKYLNDMKKETEKEK
jgi:hypothetical protein